MTDDVFESPAPVPGYGPSKPFVAGHDSECTGCGGEIVGMVDEIVMYRGEAYHEQCGDQEFAIDIGMPEWTL